MTTQTTNAEVAYYYGQKYIQYAVCSYVQHRTMDFIIPRELAGNEQRTGFRYQRCNNPTSLQFFFEKREFLKKPFNLYASVATVNSKFPVLSFDRSEESEQRDEISENFKEYLTGYDLKFDIDNPKLDVAAKEALLLYDFLAERQIPFWCMFSGNKGFNFTVPYSSIPQSLPLADLPAMNELIASNLQKKLNIGSLQVLMMRFLRIPGGKLDSVDQSVYTLGRVFKVPYSVDRHENLIALPLDDREAIKNFRKEDFTIKNVMRNFKLMNRGLLLKNGKNEAVASLYSEFGKAKLGIMDRLKAGIDGFRAGVGGFDV